MSKTTPAAIRVGFNRKWKPLNRYIFNNNYVNFFHQSLLLRRYLLRYLRRQKIACTYGVISYNYGTWFLCLYLFNRIYYKKLYYQALANKYRHGKASSKPAPYKYKTYTFMGINNRWRRAKLRRFCVKSVRNFVKKKHLWLDYSRITQRRWARSDRLFGKSMVTSQFFVKLYYYYKENFLLTNGTTFGKSFFRWARRIFVGASFYLPRQARWRKSKTVGVDPKPFRKHQALRLSRVHNAVRFYSPQLSFLTLPGNGLTWGRFTHSESYFLKRLSAALFFRSKRLKVSKVSVGRLLNDSRQVTGLQPYVLKYVLSQALYGTPGLAKISLVLVWLQKYRLKLWRYFSYRAALKALGRFRFTRYALNLVLLRRLALILRRPDLISDYLNVVFRRVRLGQGSVIWCLQRCFKYFLGFQRLAGFHYAITGRFGRSTRTSVRRVGVGRIPYSSVNSQLSYQYGNLVSRFGIFGVRFCWRYLANTQVPRSFKPTKYFLQGKTLKYLGPSVAAKSSATNFFFLKHQKRVKRIHYYKRYLSRKAQFSYSGKRIYRVTKPGAHYFQKYRWKRLLRKLFKVSAGKRYKKSVKRSRELVALLYLQARRSKLAGHAPRFLKFKLLKFIKARKLRRRARQQRRALRLKQRKFQLAQIKFVFHQERQDQQKGPTILDSFASYLLKLKKRRAARKKKPSRFAFKSKPKSPRQLRFLAKLKRLKKYRRARGLLFWVRRKKIRRKWYWWNKVWPHKRRKAKYFKVLASNLVPLPNIHNFWLDGVVIKKKARVYHNYMSYGPNRGKTITVRKPSCFKIAGGAFGRIDPYFIYSFLFAKSFLQSTSDYYKKRAMSLRWSMDVKYRWEARLWARLLEFGLASDWVYSLKGYGLSALYARNSFTNIYLPSAVDEAPEVIEAWVDFYSTHIYELLLEFDFFETEHLTVFDVATVEPKEPVADRYANRRYPDDNKNYQNNSKRQYNYNYQNNPQFTYTPPNNSEVPGAKKKGSWKTPVEPD